MLFLYSIGAKNTYFSVTHIGERCLLVSVIGINTMVLILLSYNKLLITKALSVSLRKQALIQQLITTDHRIRKSVFVQLSA